MSRSKQLRRASAVLLPLALMGCGAQVSVPTATPLSTATPAPVSRNFKDGDYSAIGDYLSPGGPEQVEVQLTLKDGLVTVVAVVPRATRPISVKMQSTVRDNVAPLVVGKPIADLSLDKVSGSSLTPKGFNDALEKIRTQAQA